MEGGIGPTDPVQAASFNVPEAVFLDLYGRRIKESVCSKVLVLGEHENELFCAPLIKCSDFPLGIISICHCATVYVYVCRVVWSSFAQHEKFTFC